MPRWLEDHALSLSFALLFVLAVAGQSIAGHLSYNSDQALCGLSQVSYMRYLRTGNFLDGMFTNWQAALLQLGCLIVFGSKLREKGAAHSLRPKNGHEPKSRDGDNRSWLYRNSLSLAFAGMFLLALVAHLFSGTMDYNENRARIHQPPATVLSYAHSSAFWFANAQTWEAEFAVIGLYVVLSVYLRQKGSPESKPVDSSNEETGETNH